MPLGVVSECVKHLKMDTTLMTHASKSIDQETAPDRQNGERNFFQMQKNKVLHFFTSESQMIYSLSFDRAFSRNYARP
ncbi:hypothetical protein OH708_00715 [Pseudomonas capsici]|uniref:hypothetical protein n=1 Tax=Pseudomonas capsici TaxID=2810614 RepID=UPI000E3BAC8B|nr:hypothetical protein [Pseudomonas capsici]MBX8607303.1 hypothetical protein [Pseudomonas cichorii]MCV4286418.1 hypothetical protein [Pseudomonas capsici]